MKQIFDWLREQIEEEPKRLRKMKNQCISLTDSEVCAIEEKAYGFYRQCVNEAEAKWESDCCIRVVGKPFTSSCGQKYDKWTYVGEPYCAKCGKPIKISEVE